MRPIKLYILAGAVALAACAPAEDSALDSAEGSDTAQVEDAASTQMGTEGAASEGMSTQESSVEFDIIGADGEAIGTASLTPDSAGVRIQAQVSGLTPGKHGVHIHATGSCEPPAFESAGPHFAPDNRSHGFLDPQGPHSGDLPMLDVNEQGETEGYEFTTAHVTLDSESLLDEDGSALILHAEADDYLTDTGGGTGRRIACGVIGPAGSEAESG